jgi:hypothetical protein
MGILSAAGNQGIVTEDAEDAEQIKTKPFPIVDCLGSRGAIGNRQ